VELFGGLPVAPSFGPRASDWLVGTRAARALGPGRVGFGWMQHRDHGELAGHELALDAAVSPSARLDLAGGAAWDLAGDGLAELKLSAGWRPQRDRRLELFAVQRSAAHLLPATSLFTVLGDSPSLRTGLTGRWRIAPRLDLRASAALSWVGDHAGLDASCDARLRLDDDGVGVLGLELRRQDAPGGGWSGVRASARLRLASAWRFSTELELVVPDEPDGRGALWPWGLAALRYAPAPAWEVATAIEAGASPTEIWRVDGLVRVTRAWGGL
jgi:hypothetical protein